MSLAFLLGLGKNASYKCYHNCSKVMLLSQVVLVARVRTVANHATVSMWWRSTTQMEITGERALLSLVLNCHCAPLLPTQGLLEARYMFVGTTKEQVRSLRDLFVFPSSWL